MKRLPLFFRRRSRGRGVGMVELLISLAISAMLLTAVAAAFEASASGIQANDQFFSATQAGRVALTQILTQVRRAKAVQTSTNRVDLITATNQDVSYLYYPDTKTLVLVLNAVAGKPTRTVAKNVSACTISSETLTNEGGIVRVVQVSVDLTILIGENEVHFSDSAAPRRLLN